MAPLDNSTLCKQFFIYYFYRENETGIHRENDHCYPGSINNRRGFAAILCLKDRNTCLWLQQQRMHLLMKGAQMLCSRRDGYQDGYLGSHGASLIHRRLVGTDMRIKPMGTVKQHAALDFTFMHVYTHVSQRCRTKALLADY